MVSATTSITSATIPCIKIETLNTSCNRLTLPFPNSKVR